MSYMSNLIKRTVFGALYVGLILASILLGDYPEIRLIVFSLLAFVGILEYSHLVGLHRLRPLRAIADALAGVYAVLLCHLGYSLSDVAWMPYWGFVIYVIVRAIYSDRPDMPSAVARELFGQLYVALPLALAGSMLQTNTLALSGLVLLGFVCIWANDTGAFVAGSTLGKRKLFPSVSPNKSWEGFFGGVVASMLAAWLLSGALGLCPMVAIGIGAVISVFATWGDLFESMLKRNAGVKDSGQVIPGHGGVLDRIDSVLFVLPTLAILANLLQIGSCTL